MIPICPYCNQEAELIDSIYIYRYRSYGKMWICYRCDAHVGCHKGTDKPLGTLANAELKKARQLTHKEFDRLWKKKHFTRTESYKMLADFLGITKDKCHIGMFDIETCREVWLFSKNKLKKIA
jgi:hypothetical protein